MYRTYRELYRARTEITTIGKGVGAIKLGKYVAVGLDIIFLGVIAAIFPGFLIAVLIHLFFRLFPVIVWQIAIGVLAGAVAKQFDPQGKSALTWTLDVLAYFRRKRITDGFKTVNLDKKIVLPRFSFYAVDQGIARATPISGKGSFTLHKPLSVSVLRDGTWIAKRVGHLHEPGKYRVVEGEIRRMKDAPMLRRQA